MPRSRVARRGTKRERTKKNVTWLSASIAVVAVLALGAAFALGLSANRPAVVDPGEVELSAEMLDTSSQQELTPQVAPDAATALIEVPDVCGMQLEEAETLLAVAGFSVIRVPTPVGESQPGVILTQDPVQGSRIGAGSDVSLVYADAVAEVDQTSTATATGSASGELVVCIDPGHQLKANLDTEPVGPGSSELKPKVTGGATGAVTKQTEHALALIISNKVKERLQAKGVTVVMTRVADAVDISNRQRAEVANKANAQLFVRIHADGSVNADIQGISTLYPANNSWVSPIEARSVRAARLIQDATVKATGATDRGLTPRGDIAGFNWSTVPAVLIETGFLSSPVEDKLLATGDYQDKLADGIAAGILAYLDV